MAVIFDVVADAGDGKVRSFGARRSRGDAEAHLAKETRRYAGSSWRNFRIEEVDTTGLFEIPPRPTPRERYSVRAMRTSPEGSWPKVAVEVLDGERLVGRYDRNYGLLRTFEPFRQRGRDYGLLTREERFGYLILDTGEAEGREVWRDAHEFIHLWSWDRARRVDFRTRQIFDLETGKASDPFE